MAVLGSGNVNMTNIPGGTEMVVILKTSTEELANYSEGKPFIAAAKNAGVSDRFVHEILVDMNAFTIEKAEKGVGYVIVKKKARTLEEWIQEQKS